MSDDDTTLDAACDCGMPEHHPAVPDAVHRLKLGETVSYLGVRFQFREAFTDGDGRPTRIVLNAEAQP